MRNQTPSLLNPYWFLMSSFAGITVYWLWIIVTGNRVLIEWTKIIGFCFHEPNPKTVVDMLLERIPSLLIGPCVAVIVFAIAGFFILRKSPDR